MKGQEQDCKAARSGWLNIAIVQQHMAVSCEVAAMQKAPQPCLVVGLGDEAVRNTELALYQHFSGGERTISALVHIIWKCSSLSSTHLFSPKPGVNFQPPRSPSFISGFILGS